MKKETNVWVPSSAVIALDAIQVREHYRSRNQTLERLLQDYVIDQQGRDPHDRLVHIATLLRWPPPRREDKSSAQKLGVAPSGRQLRVRIEEDLWTAAREFGFMLPGQSAFRGHHDYQARRGTDAVLTSIARQHLLLGDPEIGDLAQLLTRRQAKGLWRLAVEGASTTAERDVLYAAEQATEVREIARARGEVDDGPPTRVVRVATKLQTSEVTWHASERFGSMRAIAREHLSAGKAAAFLSVLDEVDDDTVRWRDELHQARAHPVTSVSREGRGASAVWRAERAVAVDDLMAWFGVMNRTSTSPAIVMNPPGWKLRFPTEWVPALVDDSTPEVREGLRTGSVLAFPCRGENFAWPTRETSEGRLVPVPGFETVIAEASTRSVVDVLEAALIDFTRVPDGDEGRRSVWVPAHVAHDLGLLTAAERDRLVAAARTAHAADVAASESGRRYTPAMNVDVLFADLEENYYTDSDDRERARMAYARGFRPLLQYLAEIDYPTKKSEHLAILMTTAYRWPVATLADVVQVGTLDHDTLRWLSAYVLARHDAILNADERDRWVQAERYREELSVFSADGDDGSSLDKPIVDNIWPPDGDESLDDVGADLEEPPF
ncbi:hypothetical protein CYJ73_25025 [Gordonia terrae]|uniref:Uncharacterized protein n=1 Tax=Gordonia terrae TaxID=2055 RepID=A0A2I1R131_9ACTN|nr:hypothetical protein [Gordonia terrae]PKZ62840.1 hypothetical protein CYJ73_25025 [Gordonia terrae]